MSENAGILQVPVAGKSADNNDAQKLVYVRVPKNKDTALPTTFTLTKSTKLSGGSNITFSPKSTPSPSSKVRPSILGNKITISPTIGKSTTNLAINSSKSIKVSLSSSRNVGSTSSPTIFRAANTVSSNLPSNFISQGPTMSLTSRSSSEACQARSPNIVSQVSNLKSQKPVFLQSKILSSIKANSPKLVSQKIMPVPLTAKQSGKNSALVSYGKILPGVVTNSNNNMRVTNKNNNNSSQKDNTMTVSSSGVKRDHFGTPKREGGCLNAFTPPPLILQSGNTAKKLGNKKGCPPTISIVTGKASSSTSGINFYPLARSTNNNNKNSNNKINKVASIIRNSTNINMLGTHKLMNGQEESETNKRVDGCESKVLTRQIDEDLKNKLPDSTTFFKKVNSTINKHMEQKDILQEAMTAMVSDIQEVSEEESSGSSLNTSQISNSIQVPLVSSGLQNKKNSSLPEAFPIILSKNGPPGCPTSVLLQGTLPLPSSGTVPVTVHNVIPLKVHSSTKSNSSHSQSQTRVERQSVPGLIIRTDTVTVRRKVPGSSCKEEDRKESTKPDLSIIPILRNNNSSTILKSAGLASVLDNSLDSVQSSDSKQEDIEKYDKVENDDNFTANVDEEVSGEKTEVKELLKWENGTGSLVGSELKFKINEFNAVELVEDEALEDIRNRIGSLVQDEQIDSGIESSSINSINNNSCSDVEMLSHTQTGRENLYNPSSLDLPSAPARTSTLNTNPVYVHHARKPNHNNCRKEEELMESDSKHPESRCKISKNAYDICCCKNCGCYGLSSEFLRVNENNFCTIACSEDYSTKEAEWMKEKQKLEKNKQNRIKKAKLSEKDSSSDKVDPKVKDGNLKDEKEEIKDSLKDTKEETKNDTAKEQKDVLKGVVDVNSKQLYDRDSSNTEEVVNVCSGQSYREDLNCSQEESKFHHMWQDAKTHSFSWVKYLEHCGKGRTIPRGAPLKLWSEPFPFGKNLFKTGMKLEGIDPQHQSLFCVMTVADVLGHRIRLHFDGYSDMYDFWCNANSPNIFQAGWCEKNGRKLETPPSIYNFTWNAYLEHCKAFAAPKNAFATSTVAGTSSNFRVGMKLEAEDRKNGWMCVATVADVLDNRILVHFDGWDKAYDTWFETSSPFIHPVGWCSKNGVYLYPPKDYSNTENFNWHEYLQETNSTSVPARAFKTRLPKEFKADMKLEAVDKKNPMLVRVATVAEVKPFKLLLHFDGWPDVYDFWVDDDSPDVHPPTWCSKSGHPLQPPLTPEQCAEDVDSGVGCGTQGCKGYGHVKGLIYNTHHTAYGCPYSLQNIGKDWETLLPDRLEPPKEKKKGKNTTKNFINLDASKPIPEEHDDSQKKRVRKRRKFFDELSPPEGISKPKIPKTSSSTSDDLNNKNQGITAKVSSNFFSSQSSTSIAGGTQALQRIAGGTQALQSSSQSSSSSSTSDSAAAFSSKKSSNSSSSNSEIPNVETIVHQSIFNPGYHPNPPSPIPHSIERHKHIIASVNVTQRTDVDAWRPDDVCNAVSKIPGCEIASLKFMEQEIDGEALLMLTQNDLVNMMGVKLGPAIKIMSFVFSLKNMP